MRERCEMRKMQLPFTFKIIVIRLLVLLSKGLYFLAPTVTPKLIIYLFIHSQQAKISKVNKKGYSFILHNMDSGLIEA